MRGNSLADKGWLAMTRHDVIACRSSKIGLDFFFFVSYHPASNIGYKFEPEVLVMVQLVTVALYDRGDFSRGDKRRIFGYEAYHWGIIVMPETAEGPVCHAYSATDASEIDPVTFRMNNPTMGWWLRQDNNMDPDLDTKLFGRIIIGQLPDEVSTVQLNDLFESIPLPVKNTHPQQSCVTWLVDAICALQRLAWLPEFDIGHFQDWALLYGDERIKGESSTEPSIVSYVV
ncbi:hypothetical protein F53441_1083 [Fusarium austroafricanum]|uniref:Uncharacterized protein n=1 Tax=Fusarium austroafricanum TaxID=2364996 RepID=A0A8H4PDR8_9HYPO|nr:hypothetical protein F53441_1083 [Fusarium austroafricanum]